MDVDIGSKLSKVARELSFKFSLNGKSIPPEEVFMADGLLPAIVRRADQLCSFCLGYGLGITFDEAPNTRLGVAVKFDDATPFALRLLCAVEILYELLEASPTNEVVVLDDLMYD